MCPMPSRRDYLVHFGAIRDSLLATAEKGEAFIRIAVEWVAQKMRQMIQQSLVTG